MQVEWLQACRCSLPGQVAVEKLEQVIVCRRARGGEHYVKMDFHRLFDKTNVGGSFSFNWWGDVSSTRPDVSGGW